MDEALVPDGAPECRLTPALHSPIRINNRQSLAHFREISSSSDSDIYAAADARRYEATDARRYEGQLGTGGTNRHGAFNSELQFMSPQGADTHHASSEAPPAIAMDDLLLPSAAGGKSVRSSSPCHDVSVHNILGSWNDTPDNHERSLHLHHFNDISHTTPNSPMASHDSCIVDRVDSHADGNDHCSDGQIDQTPPQYEAHFHSCAADGTILEASVDILPSAADNCHQRSHASTRSFSYIKTKAACSIADDIALLQRELLEAATLPQRRHPDSKEEETCDTTNNGTLPQHFHTLDSADTPELYSHRSIIIQKNEESHADVFSNNTDTSTGSKPEDNKTRVTRLCGAIKSPEARIANNSITEQSASHNDTPAQQQQLRKTEVTSTGRRCSLLDGKSDRVSSQRPSSLSLLTGAAAAQAASSGRHPDNTITGNQDTPCASSPGFDTTRLASESAEANKLRCNRTRLLSCGSPSAASSKDAPGKGIDDFSNQREDFDNNSQAASGLCLELSDDECGDSVVDGDIQHTAVGIIENDIFNLAPRFTTRDVQKLVKGDDSHLLQCNEKQVSSCHYNDNDSLSLVLDDDIELSV
ncbi:hypothetical protein CYMTET_19494 [Cymbomonas tetramitiformis]|uniref:Uncharacterized protein n=1 Tax=Cymbomonas tetramitiformis TaxID=36881 RepID=A0AAE0G7A9_9CHLO|nr:hypothetical protein CYMTET_19494 [Cymbomonas tetramitiformis]